MQTTETKFATLTPHTSARALCRVDSNHGEWPKEYRFVAYDADDQLVSKDMTVNDADHRDTILGLMAECGNKQILCAEIRR